MEGNAEPVRGAGHDGVDDLHIGVQQNPPIVAAFGQQFANAGVAELDDGGFVDLQIGAAGVRQGLHLGVVGGRQIGPEGAQIGIHLGTDIGAPGPVMDEGGAGQGHFRRAA